MFHEVSLYFTYIEDKPEVQTLPLDYKTTLFELVEFFYEEDSWEVRDRFGESKGIYNLTALEKIIEQLSLDIQVG